MAENLADLLSDRELLIEDMEDDLVTYDEQGTIFGTSGAGAFFLASYLVKKGWTRP